MYSGAVYFIIANVEPYMGSKVDAIHLENYNTDILAPFCDELNQLSKV